MVSTANRCGLLADAVSASPTPLPVAILMRKKQFQLLANRNLSTLLHFPVCLALAVEEENLVKEREAREESSRRRHAIAMAIASASGEEASSKHVCK